MYRLAGKRIAIGLWGLCLFLHGVLALAQVGEVVDLAGGPELRREGQVARLLRPGEALFETDTVRTDQRSRVEILLRDGSRLVIDRSSSVSIRNYVVTGEPDGVLQVLRGRMRSAVSDTFSRRRNAFRVRTSTAVVGVQGTDFLVEAFAASTRITVYSGLVEVINADPAVRGSQTLGPRQTVLVRRGEPPPPPTTLTAAGSTGAAGIASAGERDRRFGTDPWSATGPSPGHDAVSTPTPAVVVPPEPNLPR